MNNNEIILKEFGDYIENLDKLSFKEAQSLYIKLMDSNSDEEKIRIRNKIIEGTVYIIYEFLKKSIFLNINSRYFDMNDVISFTTEYYIKSIDSGYLINGKNFYYIFYGTKYYTSLKNELIGEHIPNEKYLVFEIIKFKKILQFCADYFKENNEMISFNYFVREANMLNLSYEQYMTHIYNLINKIIIYLNENNIEINNQILERYIYILITITNEVIISESENPINNEDEKLLNRLYSEEIADFIKGILTNKNREFLGKFFGIFDYEKEEIHNYSHLYFVAGCLGHNRKLQFKMMLLDNSSFWKKVSKKFKI